MRALVELARGQGAQASAGARDATPDVLEAYTLAGAARTGAADALRQALA